MFFSSLVPAADLKKLSSNMTSLAIEKGKMDKAATSKKKGGKFKGAKLKMDNVSSFNSMTIELFYANFFFY